MSSKPHRVVLGAHAFRRIAVLLEDRAVECAENEGWPIPADAREPPRVVARSGFVQRVAVLFRRHVRKEWHFWSGKRDIQRRIRVRPFVPLPAAVASP